MTFSVLGRCLKPLGHQLPLWQMPKMIDYQLLLTILPAASEFKLDQLLYKVIIFPILKQLCALEHESIGHKNNCIVDFCPRLSVLQDILTSDILTCEIAEKNVFWQWIYSKILWNDRKLANSKFKKKQQQTNKQTNENKNKTKQKKNLPQTNRWRVVQF